MTKCPFRVAIIGAGFGGIAAAVKLRKYTDVEYTIFEREAGVGGTWFINRYPGCEVDVHSHAYSFSFIKYDWPRTHGTQEELQQYADWVVDTFGIRPHIRFNTVIAQVRWFDEDAEYEVTTAAGDRERFNAVISAVGLLDVPNIPAWPGLDSFQGVTFHTSRWEHQHDLAGKRIAVVGTGSTAAQVVPALAPIAGELFVYQREPGWVRPKSQRPFTPRERWIYKHVPFAQRWSRAKIFWQSMRRANAHDVNSRRQRRMRAECEAHINRSVQDPEIRKALTPTYPYGCKRVVTASDYYPVFNRPNVTLVPHAVTSVTPTGIVDATGTERPVDVLVLSTGFQPTRFLVNIKVYGRDGIELHNVWKDRQSAFLGITVPGFPNFFILYGPNTNGATSVIAQLETQAAFAARAIRRLRRRRKSSVDTNPTAAEEFVRWIDHQLDKHASVWSAGCTNYYHDEHGANVTQWPRSHLLYALLARFTARWALRYS